MNEHHKPRILDSIGDEPVTPTTPKLYLEWRAALEKCEAQVTERDKRIDQARLAICSLGLEKRDHPTLEEAIKGLSNKLERIVEQAKHYGSLDRDGIVTTEGHCSICGCKLTNAETARLNWQGEAARIATDLHKLTHNYHKVLNDYRCTLATLKAAVEVAQYELEYVTLNQAKPSV